MTQKIYMEYLRGYNGLPTTKGGDKVKYNEGKKDSTNKLPKRYHKLMDV